jgi:hypothetical protein
MSARAAHVRLGVNLCAEVSKMPADSRALAALAIRAGVPRRAISRIVADQPVNAGAFLNVCGALGLDPVTGGGRPLAVGFDIQWGFFGCGLKRTRMLRKLSVRQAAQLANVSVATVSRAEAGRPISAESYLALCAFIGPHPHHYARRFTGNVHCNSLKSNALVAFVAEREVDRRGRSLIADDAAVGRAARGSE